MKHILKLIFITCLIACNPADDSGESIPLEDDAHFISAVDISSYPEIEMTSPIFYDLDNQRGDFLAILKKNGVNTIRLRLWVNPSDTHSSFAAVKTFAQRLKTLGFKIWLTLHYSDTWADPGNQVTPRQWQNISFAALKDSVKHYTARVVEQIDPAFIQIGNEINAGFLHPAGNLGAHPAQFMELMSAAIQSVRMYSATAKIMIHYAGIKDSEWFFNQVSVLDYDIMGISYYPIWHGKDLNQLKNTLQTLSQTHQKEILIAETAYPFTLDWNDWTHNIVGTEAQLVLPDYPATIEGQRAFIHTIKTLTKEIENGIGFCYWGAELIAWKGTQSIAASPWENQALFDFDNKALPVLKEFKVE